MADLTPAERPAECPHCHTGAIWWNDADPRHCAVCEKPWTSAQPTPAERAARVLPCDCAGEKQGKSCLEYCTATRRESVEREIREAVAAALEAQRAEVEALRADLARHRAVELYVASILDRGLYYLGSWQHLRAAADHRWQDVPAEALAGAEEAK